VKVTAIKQQVKRRDRASVYLDEKFWTGMSQDLLLRLGLYPGMELGKPEVKEIEAAVVEDSALAYALNRLSRVATSEQILTEKLEQRGYGPDVIEQVLERCRELALIDDELLAQGLAQQAADSGRGRTWAQRKLKEKGLAGYPEVLDEVFSEDDTEPAAEALRKMTNDRQLDRRQQQRYTQTLVRRGFSISAARQAVAAVALSDEEEIETHGVDEALELLRRRYPKGLSRSEQSKAYAFLMRRGYLTPVITRALDRFNND
jgi:regulatory protein